MHEGEKMRVEYKWIERTHILLDQVKKSYHQLEVLKGIHLSIQQGEFIAIVGKSGCGKSTLLRLIAGLEPATEGNIYVNRQALNSLNQDARIMFQDGRLLPWKTVIDNIAIGLPKEMKEKAFDSLKNVGLSQREHDYPRKLSGGQQQRVALARALVHNPEILLLDEPLGALDALTRLEMQALIEALWLNKKFTAILVTHDVEEAVAIADRVVLIENGLIKLNQQIDLPRPRQRTHSKFSLYVDQILKLIMNKQQSSVQEDNQIRTISG